ncbi:general substrate transporter [Xylariales sp. PMI_506]|nr:general substrate transporter [Xylariales sp. PMI_506]
MSSTIRILSKFPAWVPRSSNVVNILLLATAFSTASVLGYDASMMNALNILPSYTDYFQLTTATIGLNSGIIWVGACFGSIGLAKLPDYIGRRPSLFYSGLVAIVGTILQAAAQNIAMFLVARFILGVGIGGTYVAGPLFLAETLPLKYRALGLGAFTDLYYVGGLLSSGITYGTAAMDSTWAWRLPSLLQILFIIISIITLPFVPESPRFLIYQDRQEEALLALAQTHSDGDINSSVVQAQQVQILESLNFEKTVKEPSIKDLAVNPSLRKRMLIVMSVAVFSMLTGSNIFSYYLGEALDNAGITSSVRQLEINIILNAFCLVISIVGTLLADRLGRVFLAATSTALCTVFLFIIGALTKYYGTSTNTTAIYANVAMMFLAQGTYSFGWTPISTMYPPEVLNYQIRSIGMSWFTTWQNVVMLIPIFAFPIAIDKIGWKIYVLNGVWNVFEFLVVVFYWVETRNMSLEEVSAIFDGEVHSNITDIKKIIQGQDGALESAEKTLATVTEVTAGETAK